MPESMPERDKRTTFIIILVVTLVRIPLAVIFSALLLWVERSTVLLAACLGLLALIELTDLLDGYLARRMGSVTEWGAMMDPYADSMARLIVYWSLAVTGLTLPVVPLVMALRDVTVGYCRITLTRKGKSVAANISGKVKAIVQGGASGLLLLGPLYWNHTGVWTMPVFSWIVIAVTTFSVFQYAKSAILAAMDK
jgi:CDP-diacylglycerol---glycerol-3-phosphate 3-phosphatidyltransferase